jgi:ABC-type Fe3+ transport system permease subunit
MKYIRERLGAKFFLANLIVILVGISILAITIQATIPVSFNRHMAGMMTNGMGMGQGQGYGKTLFDNFRASMFESLGYAVIASVVAALLVVVLLHLCGILPRRHNTSQRGILMNVCR